MKNQFDFNEKTHNKQHNKTNMGFINRKNKGSEGTLTQPFTKSISYEIEIVNTYFIFFIQFFNSPLIRLDGI